jgi:hypothetical protein
MAIVFDHVEGVVQRQPEDGGEEPVVTEGASDPQKLTSELEHQERRRQRLVAD